MEELMLTREGASAVEGFFGSAGPTPCCFAPVE
jgi:hypothetical protein